MGVAMPERPWFVFVTVLSLIVGVFLIASYVPSNKTNLIPCYFSPSSTSSPEASAQLSKAILHYATSSTVPQQSKTEITVSLNVLLRRRPCNFLVFGLGHDSPMWASFNPDGYTLFLEEDLKWYNSVMKIHPFLNAKYVKYTTQLQFADEYLRTYRNEPSCLPKGAYVKGNKDCRLALSGLPKEVYEREWDVIMIDAPKGYFRKAPGRMAAIWTAVVWGSARKGMGETDVFLHDVDRKVEKAFAMEFLCENHRVGGAQRLWHFRIPKNASASDTSFC